MVSLLRSIRILSIILFFCTRIYCQKWQFNIELPVINYQMTNINDIDNNFINGFNNWVPNFRFNCYYKALSLGIEFYSSSSVNLNTLPKEGEINSINLNTYSLIIGYYKQIKLIKLLGGIGLTYNSKDFIYIDYYPQPWEAWVCNEKNDWGPMFWTSIKYKIFKGLNMGLNLRFNPMLKPFQPHDGFVCTTPHSHDRIHYFVSQLTVGYAF